MNTDVIVKNIEKDEKAKVKYVIGPKEIRSNCICALVRVRNIEEAELICKDLNHKTIGKNLVLRCHIHPQSNYSRPTDGKSRIEVFRSPVYFQNPEFVREFKDSCHST